MGWRHRREGVGNEKWMSPLRVSAIGSFVEVAFSIKLKLRSLTLSGIHPLIDPVYLSCCGKQVMICSLRCFPATAF